MSPRTEIGQLPNELFPQPQATDPGDGMKWGRGGCRLRLCPFLQALWWIPFSVPEITNTRTLLQSLSVPVTAPHPILTFACFMSMECY